MSALHVHGQSTPTSRVIRNSRTLVSPLKRSSSSSTSVQRSPRARPRPRSDRSSTAASTDSLALDQQVTGVSLPVVDFTGLDILSGIDYLKRIQSTPPQNLSTERRTALLVRRRAMPALVLSHQLTSLFPNMQSLERDLNVLVMRGDLIEIPLQDGDPAFIRRNDYCAPESLLSRIQDLSSLVNDDNDEEFRRYVEGGWILRRDGRVVLSAPNIGTFFSALKSARKYVMVLLKSRIVLEKDIRTRYEQWKEGGLFQFENLMHDLVGSGRVEILMLTVGRALRLTKRGRDGK